MPSAKRQPVMPSAKRVGHLSHEKLNDRLKYVKQTFD
jgi:hypothetical protein